MRLCVHGDSAALPLPLPRSPSSSPVPFARAPHPGTARGWLPPSRPSGYSLPRGRAVLLAGSPARRPPVDRRGAERGAGRRGSAAQNGADGGAARVAVVLRRDRVVRRRVLHPPARPAQGAGAEPERRSGDRGRPRGSGARRTGASAARSRDPGAAGGQRGRPGRAAPGERLRCPRCWPQAHWAARPRPRCQPGAGRLASSQPLKGAARGGGCQP